MPIKQIDDRYYIPSDNTPFRRYLDKDKNIDQSLDFLNTSELHFSKVGGSIFENDEVMFSIADKQFLENEYRKAGKPNPRQLMERDIQRFESEKKYTYINCWNNDFNETRYMWDKYGMGNSTCIVTDYKKLYAELDIASQEMQIAKVEYFDGVSDSIGIYNFVRFFCRKLKDYRNESESRIIIQVRPEKAVVPFIRVKVDINQCIDRIVLGSHCTDDFKGEVKRIMNEKNIPLSLLVDSILKPSLV